MDQHRKGVFAGLGAVCLMSTVPVTIKWIESDPWVIGIARLTIAVFILLFFVPAARSVLRMPKKDLGVLALLGFFFAVHWATYFFSIKLGTATMAVVSTISFYGIFTSIFGAVFLGHHFRMTHAIGLAVCTIGTLMTAGQFEMRSGAFLGFLVGIVSGITFATLPVIHQKARSLDSNYRSFLQFLGALLLFIFTIPLGDWSAPRMSDVIGLIYLGSIGTVVSHGLWVFSTTELPTTTTSIIKYLYIPLSAVLSFFVLGETLTAMQTAGAVTIIAGSLVAVFGKNLRFRRKEPYTSV